MYRKEKSFFICCILPFVALSVMFISFSQKHDAHDDKRTCFYCFTPSFFVVFFLFFLLNFQPQDDSDKQ